MEQLVKKLDLKCTKLIQITRPEVRAREFVDFSDIRSHYRDPIKLYRYSKDCGNQTSLVLSTSAGNKNPNKTVIDIGNGELQKAQENVEVSSRHSPTQGSRKQPSITNSRSSRRRQIDEMELEKLRAKKETEQLLRERQLELEQEREEIELRRQQKNCNKSSNNNNEKKNWTRRTGVTSKDATTRRRTASSTAWASPWKRKKESRGRRKTKTSETWDDQRKLKGIWISGRWDKIVGSRRNHEKTTGWAKSVVQQYVSRRPLSPNVVIHPPTNVTQNKVKNFSAPTQKLPRCSNRVKAFSQRNWQKREFSRNEKSVNQLE